MNTATTLEVGPPLGRKAGTTSSRPQHSPLLLAAGTTPGRPRDDRDDPLSAHPKTGTCPTCGRPSEGVATVCDGCRKRRKRGKAGPSAARLPLDVRRMQACIDIAEAVDAAARDAALRRLDRAYVQAALAAGWRPPGNGRASHPHPPHTGGGPGTAYQSPFHARPEGFSEIS